jgi:pimeloyl-ACP methyl ester carboxylesterase
MTLTEIDSAIEHGYADSGGVKLHCASVGEGPLILFVHGFPDYWYTWRHQMAGLRGRYKCVAYDTRGYNLSDKPEGAENYKLSKLGDDVLAVADHFGAKKFILCGHDWGGATAWRLAMFHPERVEKLIILNLPHPAGMSRELANNPKQQEASAYARRMQEHGGGHLNAEKLAQWVSNPDAKAKYIEAFGKSDFEAMANYYKANYAKPPYRELEGLPKMQMPVLQIHGLDDWALLPGALNDTWKWMAKDFTLVTVPGAGHFVQQDAAELVTNTIRAWLGRDGGLE